MNGNGQNFSKKFKIIVSLCAVGIMILSFFGGFLTHYLIQGKTANELAWLIRTIDGNYYYDEGDGTVREFSAEDYADTLVKQLLDKYSAFYTKDEYTDIISTSRGNSYGAGLSFLRDTPETDTSIFKVSGNSSAEKAGLKSGDIILAGEYNGERITLDTKSKVLEFLGVPKDNQPFYLFVSDNGGERKVELKKSAFIKSYAFYADNLQTVRLHGEGASTPVPTIFDGGLNGLDADTGYICLDEFDGKAGEQLGRLMTVLSERGKTKLILDLCDNGGGYMSVLSEVASYLTYSDGARRPIIAVSKDKKGRSEKFRASGDNFNRALTEIVVLANENTASASECLIGAMAHYGKGFSVDNLVIVGDGVATTYGKGIMQTTYRNFLSGQALKLTTAFIYQPDGKTCIHGKGFVATAENSVPTHQGAIARAVQILAN